MLGYVSTCQKFLIGSEIFDTPKFFSKQCLVFTKLNHLCSSITAYVYPFFRSLLHSFVSLHRQQGKSKCKPVNWEPYTTDTLYVLKLEPFPTYTLSVWAVYNQTKSKKAQTVFTPFTDSKSACSKKHSQTLTLFFQRLIHDKMFILNGLFDKDFLFNPHHFKMVWFHQASCHRWCLCFLSLRIGVCFDVFC